MRAPLLRLLCCVAFLSSSLPSLADNFVVSLNNIPICHPGSNAVWQRIVDHQQGAEARDPEGYIIRNYAVYERDLWPNPDDLTYRPYGDTKRALCGRVDRYGFHDATWSDEADWNIYMIPNSPFSTLLTDPIGLGAREIHDCAGSNNNCLEAEITPDESFYVNPWFPKSGSSSMVGRQICVYGPWVADHNHGKRPEIHPSEVLWWRDNLSNHELYTVLMVQEDSNRFDRFTRGEWYYKTGPYPHPDWRPWTQVPRKLEIRFPFEVGPGSPAFRYDLIPFTRRHVTTSSNPALAADADDGASHGLEMNGQVKIGVEELQGLDEDLGVTFVDLCRNGSILRGYVRIAAQISVNDSGKEGVLVLAVTKQEVQVQAPPPDLPPSVILAEVVTRPPEEGLVLQPGDRGTGPVADLPFEIAPVKGATVDDRTVRSVELIDAKGGRTPVAFQITQEGAEGRSTLGVFGSLPTLPAWSMEVTAVSGAVYQRSSDGHTLAGRIADENRFIDPSDPTLWEKFALAAGGRNSKLPGTLAHAAELRLAAVTGYVPLLGKVAQPEEGSSASRALNLALSDPDPARRQAIFGNKEPLAASFTLTARDLVTGKGVTVLATTNPKPGEVGFELVTNNAPETPAVRLFFPPDAKEEVLEVNLTAVVTDPFGHATTLASRAWNQALVTDEGIDAVLLAVAEMRGLDGKALLTLSSLDIDPTVPGAELDRKAETARGVRLAALAAMDDEQVTVGELGEILAAVDLYASTLR